MPKTLPSDFASWEECRDFYALESIFLGQLYARHKTKRNRQRYQKAAQLAMEANKRCEEPFPILEDADAQDNE